MNPLTSHKASRHMSIESDTKQRVVALNQFAVLTLQICPFIWLLCLSLDHFPNTEPMDN
jgi:hypothetical protein